VTDGIVVGSVPYGLARAVALAEGTVGVDAHADLHVGWP
jgi:hypothetical protein